MSRYYKKGQNMASKKSVEPATVAEVRAWALNKGIDVAARGRVSAEVKEQFTKATKRPVA